MFQVEIPWKFLVIGPGYGENGNVGLGHGDLGHMDNFGLWTNTIHIICPGLFGMFMRISNSQVGHQRIFSLRIPATYYGKSQCICSKDGTFFLLVSCSCFLIIEG